jgi:putative tricarboxylic transport membrane protein
MKRKGLYFPALVVFLLCALVVTSAAKAAYPEPSKPIEWVNLSPAGGAGDIFMRTAADILNKKGFVKSKIQVTNRTGGASAVAINYTYSKDGDPYVMMQWTTSPLMALLRGTTNMKISDCTWLGTQLEDPSVLIVPYNSPYKTLKDLLADAKANPKKVNAGVNSIGSSEHLQALRIERAAGVKFNTTSFDFSPTQLIGGHIDMAFGNVLETIGHVKAKRARVLAAVSPKRIPAYKDIPTLIEQGVNASFSQYRGFLAGSNFPAEAVKFWDDAFAKMIKTKEFEDFLEKSDTLLFFRTTADTKAFITDYCKGLEEDLKDIEAIK